MGGGYYDREVEEAAPAQAFSGAANSVLTATKALHPDLNIFQKTITCVNRSPIVVCVDVTGSMGKWPKVIYDKMPMFFGQICTKNYLADPAFSFCAVGDAYGDQSPLQVAPFVSGITIDTEIAKLHVESGGSGLQSDHETYELAAYYYARHVKFQRGASKPFFFFLGDEAYYPNVSGEHLNRLILGEKPNDLDSLVIFQELKEKYNAYMIHKTLDYGGPDDEAVVRVWKDALGEKNVVRLDNPKACVDLMLGIISIQSQSRTLQTYVDDMRERNQTEQRVSEIRICLESMFQ